MTLSTTEITNTVTVTEDPDSIRIVADNFTQTGGGGGSGTVTSVSVATANGVSGTVATATTTPAITISLGAITPTTVNGLTLTNSTGTVTITNLKTFAVTNTLTLSGTDGSTLNIGAGGTLGTAAFTASSAYLAAASNLSDLASASTARTNLGLGTLATQSGTFSGTSSGTNTGDQTSIVGITGTFSQFNTAVTDAELARTDASNTFTGDQTFSGGIVNIGTDSLTGEVRIWDGYGANLFVSINALGVTDTRAWSFPDESGVFVGTAVNQTLTNKTISGGSNTLTNIALSSLSSDTTTALGVGSLNIGHASDTTLARVSAGVLSVEGNVIAAETWGTLSGTSPALTFTALKQNRTFTLSGNTTFTASGYAQGYTIEIFITCDGTTRTLSFPSWKWQGGAPASITANKTMWISLKCTGSTEGSVWAAYAVES